MQDLEAGSLFRENKDKASNHKNSATQESRTCSSSLAKQFGVNEF